jgi:Ser/Thr protein kinase RdoA (MazF antagonist)
VSASSLRILVSGMMAGVPGHGGATWAVLQYVLGLRRLGHEVWFVEPVEDAPGEEAVDYFRHVTTRFGLEAQAALLDPANRATEGVPYPDLLRFAEEADLLLNLSGLLRDPDLLAPIPLRVYLDLDPAFTQLWHSVEGIDMGFSGHHRFVTVGLSLGQEECTIPTCGLNWIPTLQPVVLDEWSPGELIRYDALTTVANWRGYGSVEYQGVFHGQKAHALRRLITLPERVPDDFLLALAIDEGDDGDRAALEGHGWGLVDPRWVASTPDRYRDFVRGSRAEFGFAKTGYTESRSGWFSDRSACYLAAGRPVLAQETGFSRHLPTGLGLLSFESEDDAREGLEAIRTDYPAHAAAARELAEARFDSDRVLGRLLEALGGSDPGGQGVPRAPVELISNDEGGGELRKVLEAHLRNGPEGGRRIRTLRRRPSPFRTSFALEELDLVLDDGTLLELMFKDLAPRALLEDARRAKPDFLACPGREVAVYRTLLSSRGVGPELHGAVDDPEGERHWLFLERVHGVELYQVGEFRVWKDVARWLARFHADFRRDGRLESLATEGPLVRHDAALLRRWMDRARSFAAVARDASPLRRTLLERLHRTHDSIVQRILAEPATLVHGEFYASNVLVKDGREGTEVVPVDWELAGAGPGLLDLAALVAGGWSEEEKRELALTYHRALDADPGWGSEAAFLETFACARLQLAIQWMGWARGWTPPAEHVQNWSEEAEDLADQLGL